MCRELISGTFFRSVAEELVANLQIVVINAKQHLTNRSGEPRVETRPFCRNVIALAD
jgi:hypothetical protein